MEIVKEFAFLINFCLLFVTYLVLQPFKVKIEDLIKSLNTNSEAIRKLQEMLNNERVHVGRLEESLAVAHKRISELADAVKELERRCINCSCRGD